MKFIDTRLHGIIDYASVGIFALAPSVLGLEGFAAGFSYLLAVAHLCVTLIADLPLGVFRILPRKLHDLVEIVAATAIIAAPFVLGFSSIATTYYLVMGVAVLGLWAFTKEA